MAQNALWRKRLRHHFPNVAGCRGREGGGQVRPQHVFAKRGTIAEYPTSREPPVSPLPLILLGSFFLSQPLLPDAYHCGRSIKCNVCARGIIGNMWRELKTLSHFKLPVICSKGACIVLQSAGEEGEKRGAEGGRGSRIGGSLSCTWLRHSSDRISVAPSRLLSSS